MPTPPRLDSPILPAFPRSTSAASVQSPLTRIIEAPIRHLAIPDSPTIRPAQSDDYMTFLDSDSDSDSDASPSPSLIMPQEQFPSFLSLDDLGFEDDWTRGWDIQEVSAGDVAGVQPRLCEVGELPVIHDGDFDYIPAAVGVRRQWGDAASDRSLQLARGRLAKSRQRAKHGRKMGWLKVLLRKLGLSGKGSSH